MNLFLIGLPGSGKSTLGKELSQLLNLAFADTDDIIITSEEQSIEELFKHKGEAYFRKSEQATLLHLSQNNDQVISTGGGTPCFYDNIDIMNQTGVSIFIDVPVETIHHRLIAQRNQQRPMLENKTDEEVLVFLKQKYHERLPFYSKALIHVKGVDIKTIDILAELKRKNIF